MYAVDLAGFGLTRPSSGRQPTVQSNADLVARFIDEVVGKPVLLVGNSMGGMISNMVAARHPELVTGVVPFDGVGTRLIMVWVWNSRC